MITQEQIKALGLELLHEYDHDQFHTKTYNKGLVVLEQTYEHGKIIAQELRIAEGDDVPITYSSLRALVLHLGHIEPA